MPFLPPPEREPPFSVSPAATVQLEHPLEGAVRSHAEAMGRLRDAVEACVAELRGMGMAPESVLTTMKALVRHVASAHPPQGYAPSRWAADGFIEDVVRWTIVAYFRQESRPPDESPPV